MALPPPASPAAPRRARPGFTLVELLVGSAAMLVVVLATLGLYNRSNRVSVDQQALAQVQHDVRSGMYFVSRDIRMAGVGLGEEAMGYNIEGVDAFGPGPEAGDAIRLLGNFDQPLGIRIRQYQGGAGGGAATAFLYDWELENAPYPCPAWYEQRMFLIISVKCPGCFTYRFVDTNAVHGCGTGTAHFDFQPGHSEINPPGGLVDAVCDDTCWDDGIVTLGDIRLYWLDTTGVAADYAVSNLDAAHGYLGIPYTLYMTGTTEGGVGVHVPIAQNAESFQLEYDGDLDDDGNLDGFRPWDATWTIQAGDDEPTKLGKLEIIKRIRRVRVQLLGRTPNPFLSVSGQPTGNIDLYRRPALSNVAEDSTPDRRKRFLLQTVASVRNMSLGLYNSGER